MGSNKKQWYLKKLILINWGSYSYAEFEPACGSTYIIGKCFTLKEAGEPSDLKSVWFCTTKSINLKDLTAFLARDTVTERRICNVLGENCNSRCFAS